MWEKGRCWPKWSYFVEVGQAAVVWLLQGGFVFRLPHPERPSIQTAITKYARKRVRQRGEEVLVNEEVLTALPHPYHIV